MNAQITVIEPQTLEYLPAKTLLRLVEKAQQTTKNAKLFRDTVTALPALFRSFEEMDIEPRFDLDNEYITLQFTGDGSRLKEVWHLLRQHAYKVSARPEKGDTQFCAFWERKGQAKFFMYFTSSVCRRVQVGIEMKEVPIYETQCGELPEIESDDKPVTVVQEYADDTPF